MKIYNTKGVLGSWKLWFSYIIEKKNQSQNFGLFLACFWSIFDFELRGKRSRAEPSQAENASARLGLITSNLYTMPIYYLVFFQTTKISQSRTANRITIPCKMTLIWFPFDVQKCSFVIYAGKTRSNVLLCMWIEIKKSSDSFRCQKW